MSRPLYRVVLLVHVLLSIILGPLAVAAEPRPIDWPALWAVWHDLTPGPTEINALIEQQPQIQRSIDTTRRQALIDSARQGFESALASANREDRFEIYTTTTFSHYDAEREGAYLALFEGGRFFTVNPVQLPSMGALSPKVEQPIKLYFSNEADLEFVPLDRSVWQQIASSLTMRPQVAVRMVVQPVGATSDAPSFSREAAALYLHNHVVHLELSVGTQRYPQQIFTADIPPVDIESVGSITSSGEGYSAPPITAEQVAMIWQKTVGPTDPNYSLAARATPRFKRATEFQDAEALLPAIETELKRRYDEFDPSALYHINFSTRMQSYDRSLGGFRLDFADKFFDYQSVFPYEPASARTSAIALPDRSSLLRQHNYKLIFDNADDFSEVLMSPAEGQRMLDRSSGRNVAMHVVFQVSSVQPPETGIAGALSADRVVRAKVIDVRARDSRSGLPLFQRTFERPIGPPVALNVAPDVGLHPLDADIRGLRVGGDPDELIAELQTQFGTAFFSKKNPQTIIYKDGQGIKGTAFVNSDYVVVGLSFSQKFDGDAIDAAALSLIQKYGEPVFDSGRQAGRFDGYRRELRWTKPGVFDYEYAGVRAEIERNETILNGKTQMEIRINLPGNRDPYRPNEKTTPDISL